MPRTKEELAAEYLDKIGYDPFEDDPTIDPAEVEQILREHDEIEAAEAAKAEAAE